MDLKAELSKRKLLVESALLDYLAAEETYPPIIHQAMRYAVMNGGKRLRPILAMEGAAVAGCDPQLALPVGCALEMIHSYSLVHDDLPAMDDDELRRGKPTCHIVYGEANAILTGDALLTRAFEVLASIKTDGTVQAENLLRVIVTIAAAAGSTGMIAGQVVDLMAEGQRLDEPTLTRMHQDKTGALFRASLTSGAILAGAPQTAVDALDRYAAHFGLAFQITDDILDVTGDEALIGKPVGSDERNDKSTYVSLFGVEQARELARSHIARALEALAGFGTEADFLRYLVQDILMRNQ